MKKQLFVCSFITLCLIFNGYHGVAKRFPRRSGNISSQDSVKEALGFLKIYYYNKDGWELSNPRLKPALRGLLNYIETPPRDTIIAQVDSLLNRDSLQFFTREPETITDFDHVPGYIDTRQLQDLLITRDREVRDSLRGYNFPVPEERYAGIDTLPGLIGKGETHKIIEIPGFKLPGYLVLNAKDSLRFKDSPDFWVRHDSLYSEFLEKERENYNLMVQQHFRDSIYGSYQVEKLNAFSDSLLNELRLSVEEKNKIRVIAYNDSLIQLVNDSLHHVLKILNKHAANDSVLISLQNANNTQTQLWLKNDTIQQTRLYIQNLQQDSVNVIIENKDNRSLRLLIDDAVVFNRFQEKSRIDAQQLAMPVFPTLHKIKDIKIRYSPWKLGVNSSIGFTQTYLANWAKGGQSALSTLSEAKGYANYNKNKTKWESYLRLRHGLVGNIEEKDDGGNKMVLQKNDDLFEISSRFGKSAFKKWYYSSEINFKTQLFNGYKHPSDSEPISAFMAPGYLTFSIGLDYNPSSDLSLFLSPITSKATFVCDTAKIDPTRYGLKEGTKSLWEPGFITKISYKATLMEGVDFETKGSLFVNYKQPFKKFDFDMESLLTLKVNHRINTKISTHLIYDDDVKFPVYNKEGEQIGKEPKWQFKEIFVIGFNYSLKY